MKNSSSSIRSLQSGIRPVFWWGLWSFLTSGTPEHHVTSSSTSGKTLFLKLIFIKKKKKLVLFFSSLTSHHNTNPENWFTASCWRERSSDTFLSLVWRTACPPLQEVPKAQRSHHVTLLASRHHVPTLPGLTWGAVAGKGKQVSTAFPLKTCSMRTARIAERLRLCRHLA